MTPPEGAHVRLAGRLGALTLDVALHLPVGVTALTGPSGSGKSTLLRAVAGLERLRGAVQVDGEIWQDDGRFLPAHRRSVGYVFQHAGLLPHLSVQGNLDYGRRRSGVDTREVARIVALLGLAPLLERATSRLSGGERQRIALGRALLTRPRLLMLDEPLVGLDASAKAELLPQLKDVFAQLAIPVLYVSHDAEEVARLAGAMLVLKAGRLVSEPQLPPPTLDGRSREEIEALALAALQAGLSAD